MLERNSKYSDVLGHIRGLSNDGYVLDCIASTDTYKVSRLNNGKPVMIYDEKQKKYRLGVHYIRKPMSASDECLISDYDRDGLIFLGIKFKKR